MHWGKLVSLSLISFLLFIGFSSCDNQSCENVFCPGNGAQCISGQCVCPAGYEGDLCEVESWIKYVGAYQVSESCTSTVVGNPSSFPYSTSIFQGSTIEIVTITNLGNRGVSVDAIVSGNIINIPEQQSGAITVSGGGEYNPTTRRISILYRISELSGLTECNAIFTPF